MVSTPTTRLKIEKQGLGENLNVWGAPKLNDALDRIDEAVAGVEAITISGTSTTLTSTNYATDQSRKACLVLSGTLTANSIITVPGAEKLYLVVNNTAQATYSLTIKTAAGSGYALRPGPQHVYCNGTDVYRATPTFAELPPPAAALDMNSQKITGLGTPTVGTDAATKTYVDGVAAASAMSAVALGSSLIDPTAGRYFTRTVSGAAVFLFSTPSTPVFEFTLKIVHTSGPITWPASVTWPGGVAPALTAGKVHIFKFLTDDTGAKWRGRAWADYTT